MIKVILAFTLCFTCLSIRQPVYTIHYLRSYRQDLIQANFGCQKQVMYGVYHHPSGPVDALYALLQPQMFQGLYAQCHRPQTYLKLFGQAQQYEQLFGNPQDVTRKIQDTFGRMGPRQKLVIDWKYLPQNQQVLRRARSTLQDLVTGLKSAGFEVYVKAPASYFCLSVQGKKYVLDIPANALIVELYGQQPGRYTTYESIFGQQTTVPDSGYIDCPKYPTKRQLEMLSSGKNIYFEKTMDYTLPGYIGGKWEQFLTRAGYQGMWFYDGFPLQTVDL